VAIEVKAPGKLGNVTAIQQAQLQKIKEAGGKALLVDSLEAIEGVINV